MKRLRRYGFIVSFLSPAVLLYGLFVVWPLLQSFRFSAYDWSGLSARSEYVGFDNFRRLSSDDIFWRALRNNLTLLVVAGLVILVLSLLLSHATQKNTAGMRFLRSVYLMPQAISLVVVAVLWQFLFSPQFGLITVAWDAVADQPPVFLGDPDTALPSVGVAYVWYSLGFYILLFAAAIRAIPGDVKEAAELDGALGLRKFWKVTWPMLWAVKRIVIVHLTISALNVFALVLLMTNGGPDFASESLLTYLYRTAFADNDFGYATAIAIANFLVAMVLSAAILMVFRRDPQEARR